MSKLKYIFIILIVMNISCKRIFKSDITHVYGTIKDKETKEPLDSVKIEVFRNSHLSFFGPTETKTDDYTYTNEEGKYDLSFFYDDTYSYSIRPLKAYYVYYDKENKATKRKLWEGRLQKENFKLTKYGNSVIEGIVTDKETDKVLRDVRVKVIIYNDTSNVLAEDITDANGSYEISFLQKYYFDDNIHDYVMDVSLNGYYSPGFNPHLYPDKTIIQNFEMEKEKK